MTGMTRSRPGKLIKLGALAVLIAAILALLKRRAAQPQRVGESEPAAPPAPAADKSGYPELVTYVVGYGLALAFTVAAFALVRWHWTPAPAALGLVFALALAQIVVHFRCFLHVTLTGPGREDLQLILFSTMIIFLMVGGTLVILLNLRMRMM